MDNQQHITKSEWYKNPWGILLILVLWPAFLTYWIWKRNWSKKIKISLIATIWFFLLAVIFTNAVYQAGYSTAKKEVSFQNPTVTFSPILPIPTITYLPSPTNISIPTDTPIPVPPSITDQPILKNEPDIYLSYTSSMKSLFKQETKSTTRLAENLGKWPNLTSSEIISIAADTVILEQLYDEALSVTSPIELQAIHAKYLSSLKLIKEAMPLLRHALDNQDIESMNQYTTKMNQSSAIMKEANMELEVINK